MKAPEMGGFPAAVVVEIGRGESDVYYFNTQEEMESFCFGFEKGRLALYATPAATLTLFTQPPPPPPTVIRVENYSGPDKKQ